MSPLRPPPRRIHVLFKTHLDIGFTDLSARVAETYRTGFIPSAISLARRLREKHGHSRFVWTTGAWLIHDYLEKSGPRARREMERAIAAGDIVWHGLPFTTHTELLDPSLLRYGLGLGRELDRRFGRRTIAAKMTDVPGHTRAMVPFLAEAGIRFLHLGVNPASTAPAVPTAFHWDDPSGASVLVVYDKRSYGGLARLPGVRDALYFAHTGDNLGPCTEADVEAVYRRLEARFPGSEVAASTLDAFAERLLPEADHFPRVSREIGDTWIHGVGTDPAKVALFRALCRWRAALPDPEAPELALFNKNLLLVAEHTWGLDVKTVFGWEKAYDREFRTAVFRRRRELPGYRRLESSWAEQRRYLTEAVRSLRGTRHEAPLRALERSLKPREIRHGKACVAGQLLELPHFEAAFDKATGALVHLKRNGARRDWAGPKRPLGLPWYEVFSAADYEHWRTHYNRNHRATHGWAVPDFLKPGVERAVERHQVWLPRLRRLSRIGKDRFLIEAGFDAAASSRFGCPRRLQVEVGFSPDAPAVEWTVQWFGKQACRVPEAFWFSVRPRVGAGKRAAGKWTLDKLGSAIDPADVVRDGNRALHAAERCRYAGPEGAFSVEHPDSPLVAPGRPSLVRFPNALPRPGEGVHFNLHNNTWGTNFPLWYEDDARFRFRLAFEDRPVSAS